MDILVPDRKKNINLIQIEIKFPIVINHQHFCWTLAFLKNGFQKGFHVIIAVEKKTTPYFY